MAVPRQTYTLYAANGRVYASNVDQKLIDLGSLTHRKEEDFRYQLDGNHLAGEGFPNANAALRHIGDQLLFFFMDGQFTALADARDAPGLHLDGVPQLEITLEELPNAEPLVKADS